LSLLGAPFGRRPIAEIEAFELLDALRKIEAGGRYETARNTREFAGRVFRYAIATRRAARDVAADLKGALTAPKVKHHAAILDAKGVGPLMRAMDVYNGQKLTKLALKLFHVQANCVWRPGRRSTWRPPSGASPPPGPKCARSMLSPFRGRRWRF
jgi:integrase